MKAERKRGSQSKFYLSEKPKVGHMSKCRRAIAIILIISITGAISLWAADVPHGSPERARSYYRQLATTLEFRDPETVFSSTIDDVATYMGYGGISGLYLQRLP